MGGPVAEDQGRPIATVPSAVDHFARLRARMSGRRPAFFLDFDGTLAPIAAHPQAAHLSDAARTAVRVLAATAPVAIISGRDRADVEAKVGLPDIVYAGSHGFDIRVPGRHDIGKPIADDVTPVLDGVEARLHARLDRVAGALVERKRFSIAAHYRNVADADAHHVADAVAAVLAEEPQLKAKPGKKVFELMPAVEWDKGRAVLWLLEKLGLDGDGIVPMFVGDDATDEDAFRALAERGIGIVVANGDEDRTTLADFRLSDVEAVIELLSRLTVSARPASRA